MATTQQQRDEFGPLLRSFRRAKGLRQREVAEALDITSANVSGWERCEYAPNDRDVAAALDELLDAGGQLLDVLGFSRPTSAETADQAIARLSAEVAALRRSLGARPPKKPRRRGGQ